MMSAFSASKRLIAPAIAIAVALVVASANLSNAADEPPREALERLPAAAMSAASSEARDAISDGQVSHGEYMAAMAREQACMRAKLPKVTIPDAQWDEAGLFLEYQFEVTGEENHLAALEAEEDCSGHRNVVEMVWSEELVPGPVERAQIAARVAGCLATRGVLPANAGPHAVIGALIEGEEVDADACVRGEDRRLFLAPRG